MTAMSGSGWSAIGSTSFSNSAALFLAGAEGGGVGLAAGAENADDVEGETALVVWDLAATIPANVAKAKMRRVLIQALHADFSVWTHSFLIPADASCYCTLEE